jgi:diguanylate cyclase (GGDEF)-like protein
LAQLHTNLDIDRLLREFSREVRDVIPHTGIGIDCPDCYLPLAEDAGALRHRIHLIVDEEYLCDLGIHGQQRLSTAELWQLELWLRVLAYPLRNAIQLHRMRTQVFRDPLTGVQNRIAMDQAMAREVSAAQRHQNELSMLVIDIDWFKSINDRFGHSTGDVALRLTADLIRGSLRDSDQVFRYGGEEFIVLLSHTDTLGAVILAERIRRCIAQKDHLVGDIRIPITVSIGVALLENTDTVDSFFERADHALYHAKDTGRNKVCCHQSHQASATNVKPTPGLLLSKAQ